MKIAITADVHLSTITKTPERYNALRDIFKQSISMDLETVLVLGDLFDKDFNNYSDFEKLANEFPKLNIWILPGNHDAVISSRSLLGKNLRIFEDSEIIKDDISLLLVPYQPGTTMGEVIASKMEKLIAKKWVLFGHGDWLGGIKAPNPLEPGTYMTLTRTDLERYQPIKVFLGHIHSSSDSLVHYPGSPCGIDITETGVRSFLVFDSKTCIVDRKPIHTDVVYQIADLLVLPVEDEVSYMHKLISEEKAKWQVNKEDFKNIKIRVKVQGYTKDKSVLKELLLREFRDFSFYKNEEPDLSQVATTTDQNRITIAENVKEKIQNLMLNTSPDEPSRDHILLESLKIIFES